MQTVTIPMEELVPVLLLQLQRGDRASLQVTGNSMAPMLHHRKDTVFLESVKAPLKKGDLILYRRDNGKYVLHRIVRVRHEGAFVCSGDHQWEPEEVFAHQVLAVVTDFVRDGKAYTNQHRGYRLYVWCWTAVFPIRRPIIWAWKKFRALCRKIKGK